MLRWRGRAYPGRVGPEERRREAPPSVGGAVAKFALVGLVALVVLVGLSVLVIGRISRSEATDDAKRITAVVGRSLIQPNLGDALLRGDPAARARLDRVVRSRVLRGGFVRVKVWTADGRIVYSDRPELVGARYRLGADDLDVLRHGGVEAGISDLTAPENRFERGRRQLLEVYLPLSTPSGRRVLFETYLPLGDVAARGRALLGSFLPPVIVALLVFALIQLLLAWSLARRLQRTHREREAALARALDASELERRRIAADLHDGTVQELVAASYGLAAARERLAPDDAAAGALGRAEKTTRSAVQELRSLMVEIYPPRLREAGLASAIEDLVTPLAQRGIRARVDVPKDLELPYEPTALVYRSAREGVRNAAKHAHPASVDVSVRPSDGHVTLVVADDGQGCSPAEALGATADGHFGLRLLADQVRDAGGSLELDSAPGAGTRLRVEVPSA
jgi:two-component system, NarL family, sensor kinase